MSHTILSKASPAKEATLKISADDYGLHPNVDKAIHTLAQKGIIQKVSVMANTNYTPAPLPHTVQTGLHIDLTTTQCLGGKPLADSPFQLLRMRNLSNAEVEDRIESQFHHVTSLGFKITHIDTHQHVHLIPTILNALINVAKKHNITTIRCLTLQNRHHPFYLRALLQSGFLMQTLKLHALYTGGCFMAQKLKKYHPNPNLILMPLVHNGNYAKLLHTFVQRFQNHNAELVTHPGLPFPSHNEPYVAGRETEYQALLALATPNT